MSFDANTYADNACLAATHACALFTAMMNMHTFVC